MDSLEEYFNEYYDRYKDLVWWYLNNKLIGSREDREDVSQKIWMAVWEHIDKIPPENQHAFLYKVIHNQINKFIYYRTRDRKHFNSDELESSEGDTFSLTDLCKTLRTADDYEYFNLLDSIESILTEEEYQFFIAYLQGINPSQMVKQFHTSYNKVLKMLNVLKNKLSYEFGMEATFPNLKKRKRKKDST